MLILTSQNLATSPHKIGLKKYLGRIKEFTSCLFVCPEITPREGEAWLLFTSLSVPGRLCGLLLPSPAPPGPGPQRQPWERAGLSLCNSPHPPGPPQTVGALLRAWQTATWDDRCLRLAPCGRELCQLSGQTCPYRVAPSSFSWAHPSQASRWALCLLLVLLDLAPSKGPRWEPLPHYAPFLPLLWMVGLRGMRWSPDGSRAQEGRVTFQPSPR